MCIADITLEPRASNAIVVPTAAAWLPSPTCISEIAANLWPACTTIHNKFNNVSLANDKDWSTEYLDSIISIKTVEGLSGAIKHINKYSSNHTESIITKNKKTAEHFLNHVDSAIVMHNASTQFADGGEFGMGAEIGISTGRLHARGPVGANQLTSFKYIVRGSGQVRKV